MTKAHKVVCIQTILLHEQTHNLAKSEQTAAIKVSRESWDCLPLVLICSRFLQGARDPKKEIEGLLQGLKAPKQHQELERLAAWHPIILCRIFIYVHQCFCPSGYVQHFDFVHIVLGIIRIISASAHRIWTKHACMQVFTHRLVHAFYSLVCSGPYLASIRLY